MNGVFVQLMTLMLVGTLTACGGSGAQTTPGPSQTVPPTSSAPVESQPAANGASHVLVAYFSATGNTENIAGHIQAALDADLYEIVPEEPYTSEDLDYSEDDCRANREQNDPNARPAISGGVENMEDYDVVFLGYPIWWGRAPRIIDTFLESYDFEDVTIVPFCTSGSSGIDGSLEELRTLASGAVWLDGRRFSGGAAQEEVAAWAEGLDLSQT